MLMTWWSRERNRSCSPLSRRSRGRIEPSANHVRGQRITAGDSRESPTSICKKIDPGAPISGKSNRWNSCNFYCPSIASGYFTDDLDRARLGLSAQHDRATFSWGACVTPALLGAIDRHCARQPRDHVELKPQLEMQ